MISPLIAFVVLAQTPAPASTFAETVVEDFERWDLNHDGKLVQEEIDKCALDPQFHGPDAAALAALHAWLYAAKDQAPELTKSWFEHYQPVRFKIEKGTPSADAKEQRKAYASTPGSLQSSFAAGLKRLSRAGESKLYDDDGPSLSDIRQGGLGDCYMLAPLGALVHRNPADVRGMIQVEQAGYRVKFPDGQDVHVSALTDTELAMVGSSTKSGYWIRVMEKAYGSRKISDGEAKVATDSMHGGSSGTAGRAFTGHKFRSVALVGDFKKEVDARTLADKMETLRKEIPAAAEAHRLIVAGTPKRDMPRSISPNHAYAVFSFDAATDRITLWNPHGNDFNPKGEESTTNGYKIVDGVFSMPLDTFVRTFGRILFEAQ